MRVFLTGGTGISDRRCSMRCVRAGHHVDALVRNREKAADVQVRGAHPVIGDLAQPDTCAAVAAMADGSIHTAMDDSARGQALDALALDTFLAGPPRLGRRRTRRAVSSSTRQASGCSVRRRRRPTRPLRSTRSRSRRGGRRTNSGCSRRLVLTCAPSSFDPASSTAASAASSATCSRPPQTVWSG